MDTLALWDTGATRTCVNKLIIEAMEMTEKGKSETNSHSGIIMSNRYKVSITLPTNGKINDIVVFDTESIQINGEDIGIIIGMDIIRCGDFHIDSVGEKTVFTFRHPSKDVTEDILIETELF